ncbi:MAG: radical SAM/SPASM domain-containing protein [Saccharofermentanales bacterium]
MMAALNTKIKLLKALASNPQIIKVRPSINLFLAKYMSRFTIRDINGQLFIHSHLPSVNSKAFTRFINEHLLVKSQGPSHAQIAITNICPQKCEYCYNKNRSGELMGIGTIKSLIHDLKEKGVIWFGFTGGEPLLKKELIEIIECAGHDCAVKIFTTGNNLTYELAEELKKSGLSSVSISLDHWTKEEHDKVRGCDGAYNTALQAIRILQKTGGINIGVSSVISKDMLRNGEVDTFLQFLMKLGVHEAWLSEAKPTIDAFRKKELIITEDERLSLIDLQDKYNREGKITVNYLGHFEGKECFGCNAGNKMVYIDAFGEVSPCVFVPMSFGNVKDEPIMKIFSVMKEHFPSEDSCFINKNYSLLHKYDKGTYLMNKEDSLKIMSEIRFGELSKFSRIYYKK